MLPARITPYGGDSTRAGGYVVCKNKEYQSQVNIQYLAKSDRIQWVNTTFANLASVTGKVEFGEFGTKYYYARVNESGRANIGRVGVIGLDVGVGAVYFGTNGKSIANEFEILTCN